MLRLTTYRISLLLIKSLMIFFVITTYISCSGDNKEKIDSNGYIVTEKTLVIEREVILEANDSSIINLPADFCRVKDEFFIVPWLSEIKVFDSDGKYLRQIGRKGSGPGEYLSINGIFAVDTTHIGIFDNRLQRLSIFTTGGTCVKQSKFEIARVPSIRKIIYHKQKYYIHVPYSDGLPYNVVVLDSGFNIIEKFIEPDKKYKEYCYRGLFTGNIAIDVNKEILYEMNSFSHNQLAKINLRNKSLSYLEFGAPDFYKEHPVPQKDTDIQNLSKLFRQGTNIINMFLLHNRFLTILYTEPVGDAYRVNIHTFIHDMKKNKTFISGRRRGFGKRSGIKPMPTYSDGSYLYELRNTNSEKENPSLMIYRIGEDLF